MIRALLPFVLVAAVGTAILVPQLGAFGFWEPLEPLYAQSAREMAERGSWAVPYFDGTVRMTKPILTYWSVLAGFGLVGPSELGARIGGVIFAILGLIAVCYATSRLFGRRCGVLSALVLATFSQFHFLARQATPDIYLATSVGTGLLFLALAIYGERERRDVHFMVAFVCCALAVLIKGPVIVLAAVAGTALLLGVARIDFPRLQLRDREDEGHGADTVRQLLRFAAVLAVVAGPWYLFAFLRQRALLIDDLLLFNHVHRFFNEVESSGSTTFYFRTITFGLYPWTGFVPVALALLGPWRGRDRTGADRAETFLIASAAMIFVIFTLSVTKFPHYFAIALVPLAVLIGRVLDRLLADPDKPAARIAFVVASMFFLLPSSDLMRSRGLRYLIESFTNERSVPSSFEPGEFLSIFVAVTLVVLLAGVLVRSTWLVGTLVACAVAFGCYCSWDLIPRLTPGKTARNLCISWVDRAAEGERLGVFDATMFGAVYYTNGRVERLEEQRDLIKFLAPTGGTRHALAPKDDLSRLSKTFSKRFPGNKIYLVDGRHPDYALVTNRKPLSGDDVLTEFSTDD